MTVETFLSRLDRVKQTGRGRWVACCPAHDDKNPSLAITETDDGKTLIHCFAGCSVYDVLFSIDLKVHDLFPGSGGMPRNTLKTERMPFSYADALRCIAFESTLAAVAAGNIANGVILTDTDKARLMLASKRINHALEVCRCK